MNRMQIVANPKFLLLLAGFLVTMASSSVCGAELVRVSHQISKVPTKRAHIHVSRSDLRLDGAIVTWGQILKKLNDIEPSVVYCEVDKAAGMSQARIDALASSIVGSGRRFFYKQHRGSIDSIDHCFEYKQEAEQAGTGQPATRSQSKSEGSDKPQPEAEGRSR
jgi:hypothetical protein